MASNDSSLQKLWCALDGERLIEALEGAETILASKSSESWPEALLVLATARCRAADVRLQSTRAVDTFARSWRSRAKEQHDSVLEAAALLASAEAYGPNRSEANRRLVKSRRRAEDALLILGRPVPGPGVAQRIFCAGLRLQAAILAEDWRGEAAFNAARTAHGAAVAAGDSRAEALALHTIALAHAASDPPSFDEAIEQEQSARSIFQSQGLTVLEARSLCHLAGWAAEEGRMRDSLKWAQEACALRCTAEEISTYLSALNESGQALKAQYVAKDGVARARKNTDKLELYRLLQVLAREYHRQGQIEPALTTFKESVGLAKQLGLPGLEYNILCELAQVHMERQQWHKTIELLSSAADVASSPTERAAALLSLAESQVELSHTAGAIQNADAAAAIFSEIGDPRGEAKALLAKSWALSKNMDREKSMAAAHAAFEVSFVANQPDIAAASQKRVAELWFDQRMINEAMRAAAESVQLWRETEDPEGLAESLRMVATLGLQRGEVLDAIEIAHQALEFSHSRQDVTGEAHAHVLLVQLYAKIYQSEENVEGVQNPTLVSMRKSAAAAQALAAQTRDKQLKAVSSHWFAEALFLSQRPPPDDAMRYARKAQALFQDIGDFKGVSQASTLIAYLLLPRKQFDEAAEQAEKAIDAAQACGDVEVERKARDASVAVEHVRNNRGAVGGRTRQIGRPGGRSQPPQQGGEPDSLGAPVPAIAANPELATRPKLDANELRNKLLDMARDVIGDDEVDLDADHALMEVGMDSLASIDFTNRVTQDFKLSGAQQLVFDFPTVSMIVDHILAENGQ